jgi:hypothetical protein
MVADMWVREPSDAPRPIVSAGQAAALAAAAGVTLWAGLYPEPFLRLASYSMLPFGH